MVGRRRGDLSKSLLKAGRRGTALDKERDPEENEIRSEGSSPISTAASLWKPQSKKVLGRA